MRALSLFSGIGGLDLAAEAAGIKTAAFCEIDEFCQTILHKRWPNVPIYSDVREIRGEQLGTIDFIHGGFPCQPFSVAGKQRGRNDNRYLWPEFSRLVGEIKPSWVVGENVPGIIDIAADEVCSDLERQDYSVGIWNFEAAAVGAPHRRSRIFFVAHRNGTERNGTERNGTERNGTERNGTERNGYSRPSENVAYSDCFGRTHSQFEEQSAERGLNAQRDVSAGGQLNPDWEECLMGFPQGWTNPDCDIPRQWQGWPAPLGAKMWGTPAAGDCQGSSGGGQGKSLRTDIHDTKKQPVDQYDYEPPRTIKGGGQTRINRVKALGNAVVPQQAYLIFKAIAEIEREG